MALNKITLKDIFEDSKSMLLLVNILRSEEIAESSGKLVPKTLEMLAELLESLIDERIILYRLMLCLLLDTGTDTYDINRDDIYSTIVGYDVEISIEDNVAKFKVLFPGENSNKLE